MKSTFQRYLFTLLISLISTPKAVATDIGPEHERCVKKLVTEELAKTPANSLVIKAGSWGMRGCLFHECYLVSFQLKDFSYGSYVGYAEVAFETNPQDPQKSYCRFYSQPAPPKPSARGSTGPTNQNLVIKPAGARQRPVLELSDGSHNETRVEMN